MSSHQPYRTLTKPHVNSVKAQAKRPRGPKHYIRAKPTKANIHHGHRILQIPYWDGVTVTTVLLKDPRPSGLHEIPAVAPLWLIRGSRPPPATPLPNCPGQRRGGLAVS